ncbi:RNA-directed DNA polymerase [Apilactobacillus micheneri]|uniref:RNA-directed DNA polymerase n=1 Tax=Apilactobacillus micheneri TaxID=1899430 RepID=A0ABY2YUW5_9LACO|nr:reverse transcriptase family protein [Apilactobacillus micheneri]TPR22833.1 RNA-directed DNA polymerase [Apilactobacillus micheneri]TPR24405.1 RNA-directed DNA polymerase [Apilactobacillus micheneri]TPR27283.1 RNA-directed DNA polymerase [Apilactobacillus micheneri]TPR28665.1 RNA-directed DNA polymerase [Apilactobacillus micheneri]TPR28725.1 RNA-directed DNA polymerase [Apilactobacillus micheneri]
MTYPINQCYLYKIHSKKRLSKIFGLDLKKMMDISNTPIYKNFYILKKNKKDYRKIEYASDTLNGIQRKIHKYLANINKPKFLTGGVKSKSILTNGKIHKNNNYWIKFDISNFYVNCNRDYIYKFFLNDLKCSPDISEILTNLTTFEGHLIQGSSSSVDLSYFAYSKMFKQLNDLALLNDLTFSTYIDDFTFSSNIPINIDYISKNVLKILRLYGHKAKRNKVKYYNINSNKLITGIVVNKNNEIRVPNYNREMIINLRRKIEDNDSCDLRDILSLIGMINSARQIENGVFSNSYNYAQNILKRLRKNKSY